MIEGLDVRYGMRRQWPESVVCTIVQVPSLETEPRHSESADMPDTIAQVLAVVEGLVADSQEYLDEIDQGIRNPDTSGAWWAAGHLDALTETLDAINHAIRPIARVDTGEGAGP